MDVIPSDDIAEPGGGGPSNGENKSLIEGFLEEFEDFFSLSAVWQVGCPGCSSVLLARIRVLRPLYPRGEHVVYGDGAAVLVPGEALPAAGHGHGSYRLCPGVDSVEGVTYGTGGLHPEHGGHTFRAEGVAAFQGFLVFDRLQADGAVFSVSHSFKGVPVLQAE